MRFTLLDVGDVEVADGTTLAAARDSLARLTGVAALRDAPLTIEGVALPAALPAGVPPWAAGSRLAVGAAAGSTEGSAAGSGSWPVGAAASARPRPTRRWVVALDGPRAGRAWPAPRLVRPRLLLLAARRRAGGEVLALARLPRRGPGDGGTPVPGTAAPRTAGGAAAWLVPVVGGVGAALVWHAPALAALSLAGLLPALLAARPVRPPWSTDAAGITARDTASHAAAHPRAAEPADLQGTWRADAARGLALTGSRADVLGAAHVLVADLLGAAAARSPREDAPLLVLVADAARRPDWRWLRWCADRVRVVAPDPAGGLGSADDRALRTAALVVVDSAHAATLAVGDAPRLALAGDRAPAWCATAVAAGRLARGTAAWAEGRARDLAGLVGRGDDPGLPAAVALADLPVDGPGAWAVPVGVGPGGPVHVDLVADGPHALVAGTTGAGKSELLQTLVLALARRHGPDRLALVLVDFKGGAGLGACRDLPHVAGLVTDLDPAATSRVLEGLRAEVRAREALLAAAGATDLEALRARAGSAPPRVVVVVDELLALRDDLPGALPALVRLATQGRALGLHLVLATQRPAGALDPQVRANVTLRVCLRVADPADGLDVVGTARAATLPVDRPGRALLRVGEHEPVLLQTAWAALAPRPAGVRWADPWPGTDGRTRAAGPDGPPTDQVAALVTAATAGHGSGGRSPALWRPPLPQVVGLDELDEHLGVVGRGAGPPADGPAADGPPASSGLRFGLVDRPADRATDALLWRPEAGPLVLVGPPGSGRSTGLRAVAQAAAARGRTVHLVGLSPTPEDLAGIPVDRRGTLAPADDPRRVLRLVELLCAHRDTSRGTPRGTDVLLVDDAGAVLRALRLLPRGVGEDALGALLAARVPLALAGDETALRALAQPGLLVRLGEGPDDHQAQGSSPGAPWTQGPGPGGGTVDGLACRLAVPAASNATPWSPAAHGGVSGAPLRLAALPGTVRAADLPAPAEGEGSRVVLGLGGDDAGPVVVDLERGLLVLGPPGSGRSAVLRHVLARVARARAAGADELLLARAVTDAEPPARPVLVLDDADVLTRDRPDLDAVLAALVAAAEGPGDGSVSPCVVASARTDRAATAFRGGVAALRSVAPVLVLDPLAPGSAEAAGADLARACDPGRRRGRAVLVDRGRAVPLQVPVDG